MPTAKPDRELEQRPAQHQGQHVSSARAERHADAEFTRPPRHGVRRDAVESDAGQDQGEQARRVR